MKSLIPFDFYIFKKKSKALNYKMSDSLREEYKGFAESIKSINIIDDMTITRFKILYKSMFSNLEKELIEAGYKKSKHTYEELGYIFQFMYVFVTIDQTINQKTLGEIFGLKVNDFSKLGIFPVRAFKYYSKRNQDKGCFKYSDAHAIAGVVNEKVQIPYLTRGQVVVSNNSDMFVDLVQGDNKRFFVTRPAEISEDTVEELMYAHARYCFCNTNNSIGLQKLKDKIIEVLEINDSVIAENFLVEVLQSNVNLDDCVRNGNVEEFVGMRKKYKDAVLELNDANEELEEEDYMWYYVYEDTPSVVKQKAEKIIERYEKQLISNIAGNKYLSKNKDIEEYKIYLSVLDKYLKTPVEDIVCDDTMLKLAASYFIVEWFKDMPTISFEDIDNLRAFVKSSKIAIYVDRICKESKAPHLMQIQDRNSLLEELENCKGISYKRSDIKGNISTEPFLLYVDIDAYCITQEEIDKILDEYQVALVIRGTSFEGLNLLDKKLQLYANMEGLANEYK